jgi:peroxiredoxin Q/BCP
MRNGVILGVLLLCASGAAQTPRRAPGFSLPDASQQQHDLQDYRGRWVLLDFMKTDCPHCAELSPVLEEAARKYGKKVAVLSVLLPPDTPANAAAYTAKHKLTSPMLFDCGQVAYSYIRPSPGNPAVQFPHLYVIDPKGMIARDLMHRDMPAGRLLAELDRLIGK